jgi:hypothetical protein
MKHIITIFFAWQLTALSAQDEHYLEKHWFSQEKVCEQEQNPAQLFSKQFPNPDNIWKVDSIVRVNTVGVCRKTEKGVETADVNLGLSYTDIVYRKGPQAQKVFNDISTFLSNKKADWHSGLNIFCKGGKVFCLLRDSCSVRVVSVNSCAHMKDFEKLIAFCRKLKKYDALLFVKCGSGPENVEVVTNR